MISGIKFKETEIGMIPEDWEVKKINQVTDQIFSGGTPNTRKSEYWDGNIPWLSSGETRTTFIFKTEKKITELGVKNSSTRLAKAEDVVVASAGQGYTRGQVSFCMIDAYINQSVVALRANKEELKPLFLFYNLVSRYNELRRISDGHSSRGSLTTKLLADMNIQIPPIEEQTAIAKILTDLDLKIALNRSMNSTLEAIGQALFRRWFVDFEFPDGEGKPYRSSGGEMEETELGEVPRGWRVGSILERTDLLSGGTPKTEIAEYWCGDIPWISAKDVTDAHGSFVIDTERRITQAGIDNSSAKLLPKNTTVVTARGTVGSYCILSREMAINQTNYGLKAKSGTGDFFIFFSISNLVNQMKQNAYGTIFDTITTKTFKEMKISIPPEAQIKSFDYKINSLMNKMLSNLQESCVLANLRDALLPKLMSGEIRVNIGN